MAKRMDVATIIFERLKTLSCLFQANIKLERIYKSEFCYLRSTQINFACFSGRYL